MAPSRPIQVIPPGLLGFLQLKNSGRSPEFFPDALQPTIELRNWYFEANAEFLQATVQTAVAGVGFQTWAEPIVVPSSELWYVINYSVYTGVQVAGDNTQFQLAWRSQTGSLHFEGQPSALVVGSAAGATNNQQASGFFVPSASEIGARIMGHAAAAVTIDYAWNLRIVRLPL